MSFKKSVTNTNNESDDITSVKDEKKAEWSIEHEELLVEWCDIAQCYRWLHMRSNRRYTILHMIFTIPTITLSTITGTASFAQASIPLDWQNYATMVIGGINIFIGIITTIQQYLKVSELNEAHRVSALSWDKYARNIKIELAKSPEERNDPKQFLKLARHEIDRLMETSPSIPQGIVNIFQNTFKGQENTEQRENFNKLKKPDICNIITTSNDKRHPWYLEKKNNNLSYCDSSTDENYYNFKNMVNNNIVNNKGLFDYITNHKYFLNKEKSNFKMKDFIFNYKNDNYSDNNSKYYPNQGNNIYNNDIHLHPLQRNINKTYNNNQDVEDKPNQSFIPFNANSNNTLHTNSINEKNNINDNNSIDSSFLKTKFDKIHSELDSNNK